MVNLFLFNADMYYITNDPRWIVVNRTASGGQHTPVTAGRYTSPAHGYFSVLFLQRNTKIYNIMRS